MREGSTSRHISHSAKDVTDTESPHLTSLVLDMQEKSTAVDLSTPYHHYTNGTSVRLGFNDTRTQLRNVFEDGPRAPPLECSSLPALTPMGILHERTSNNSTLKKPVAQAGQRIQL